MGEPSQPAGREPSDPGGSNFAESPESLSFARTAPSSDRQSRDRLAKSSPLQDPVGETPSASIGPRGRKRARRSKSKYPAGPVISSVAVAPLRLVQCCLLAETQSGPLAVAGIDLFFDDEGLAVLQGKDELLQKIPWSDMQGLSVQEGVRTDEGTPILVLEVKLEDRSHRFTIPESCVDSSGAGGDSVPEGIVTGELGHNRSGSSIPSQKPNISVIEAVEILAARCGAAHQTGSVATDAPGSVASQRLPSILVAAVVVVVIALIVGVLVALATGSIHG